MSREQRMASSQTIRVQTLYSYVGEFFFHIVSIGPDQNVHSVIFLLSKITRYDVNIFFVCCHRQFRNVTKQQQRRNRQHKFGL